MEETNVGGRPSVYTEELALEICKRLSTGESLRKICESEDMPNASTVHAWVIEDREGFHKQYARAREIQAENMFDEILLISDDSKEEIIGNDKSDGARVQSARLRVDSRKWYLSKVLPKKFGDKLDVTSDGKPIPIYGGKSLGVSGHDSDQKDIPA